MVKQHFSHVRHWVFDLDNTLYPPAARLFDQIERKMTDFVMRVTGADHGEDDATVKAKAQAAISADLTAIVCIGETEEERKSGKTLEVLGRQLEGSVPGGATAETVVIAYEPVWAIGTGLTPTPADIEEAHAFMRKTLADRYGEEGKKMRLLYGGSVKPGNATELMAIANVDGALVGGASLKAVDFLAICEAYRTQH